MKRRVGIDLSPSRCALLDLELAAGGRGRAPVHIRSFRTIPWSAENADPFVATLRLLKKSGMVPSRAVVALWGLAGESPSEAQVRAGLEPLVAAQFTIEKVVTPAMALAALSCLAPGADANTTRAYVAVNVDATAVAVARNGALLFGREIQLPFRASCCNWDADERSRSAEVVDFARRLAPELKRSLLAFRERSQIDVRHIVLCGAFPELRKLAALLTTSLQAEVETLDSIQGLAVAGDALDAALLGQAASLRVAWAAGATGSHPASLLPPAGPKAESRAWFRRWATVAGASVVIIVGFMAWFGTGRTLWMRASRDARAPRTATPSSVATGLAAERRRAEGDRGAAAPSNTDRTVAPSTLPRARTGRGQDRRARVVPIADESPARKPVVQSILYAPDRRLALIDHRVVRVGDLLEAGVVIDIEPKAVTVRGPSGELLRMEMTGPADGKGPNPLPGGRGSGPR